MADAEKPIKPPESPTTARELDFDDDEDVSAISPKPKPPQSTDATATSGGVAAAPAAAPPTQPPRPANPRDQAEATLREAFPSIDAAVVKAVLSASGGQVEPAFNALLGMSDPDAAQHEAPPPQPPRREPPRNVQPRNQLEADAAYARRLAEHYQNQEYSHSRQRQQPSRPQYGQPETSPNQQGYYDEDRERSFIDDDLPIIRDNIKKGFAETQTRFNTFFTNLKKQIDGEEVDDDSPPPPPPRRPGQASGGTYPRRSGDHARYDADPQVLGDDFTALQLKEDTVPSKTGGSRPVANPDLFKPTPATPQGQAGPRVSFQEGPPEDINDSLYRASPPPDKRGTSPAAANKNSKWQPLAAVDPDPVAEHDPFSLGDSDEEEAKKKDPKPEDAARLQRATAEAMSEDLGSEEKSAADASKGAS